MRKLFIFLVLFSMGLPQPVRAFDYNEASVEELYPNCPECQVHERRRRLAMSARIVVRAPVVVATAPVRSLQRSAGGGQVFASSDCSGVSVQARGCGGVSRGCSGDVSRSRGCAGGVSQVRACAAVAVACTCEVCNCTPDSHCGCMAVEVSAPTFMSPAAASQPAFFRIRRFFSRFRR